MVFEVTVCEGLRCVALCGAVCSPSQDSLFVHDGQSASGPVLAAMGPGMPFNLSTPVTSSGVYLTLR
jgi:hypothetical protein